MDRAGARRLLLSYFEAPAARLLARMGIAPNAVTLTGILIAGVSAYLLATGYLAAGGAVLLASGLFDLLDGAVARATGRVTAFGAILDSTVDRVSEAVVLLGLLIFYVHRDSTWGAVLVYVTLAASIMVSYLRARAEGIGVECRVGLMTRPERVAILGVALIAGHWWQGAVMLALGAVAALAGITTVQRVLHVRRALAARDVPADQPSGSATEESAGNGARNPG
jgi:CDP-diacylglycerol--glycerol-3-phosphate 3-phosphatidyltransferase